MQSFKVVLCGDVFVGKSAIFQYIQHGSMNSDELVSTISATFAQVRLQIDDPDMQDMPLAASNANSKVNVRLQLWDTAGDEKLRHITRNYYSGATAAIVVYDVTNKDSLTVAKEWIQSIRDNAPANCFIILAGNKIDLIEQIEIPKREGQSFADEHECTGFI